MPSPRLRFALTALALVLLPATAWAEPEYPLLAGKWALPIFLGDSVLLLALSFALSTPPWNRIGLALWIVLVTIGGGLFVVAMCSTPISAERWQFPALLVGLALFAFSAEQARKRLADE